MQIMSSGDSRVTRCEPSFWETVGIWHEILPYIGAARGARSTNTIATPQNPR